jgi:type I restriction enzyme S subunit
MLDWRPSTWGDEIVLEYGKALRGYSDVSGPYRVYGSNGPAGWTSKPLVDGPGVILGRKGAYRGVRYSADPFFVIDTAYYVRPIAELDMRWLYYAIIFHKLGQIDDGSPVPSTTRSAVYVRDVEIPSIGEQREIAAVLSAFDDKIELNQLMNETLEAMARAIFKDWFIDFGPTRAKMEGRAPYLDTEEWALFPDRLNEDGEPEGWDHLSLRETVDIFSGGTPAKNNPRFWNGPIPWISPKAMTGIHVSDSDDRVTVEAIGHGTRTSPFGAVLVMVRGMGLHQGVRISQAQCEVAYNQNVKALVAKAISPTHLLYAMLDAAPYLFSRVESSGHGTGVLPTSVLETLEFAVPKGGGYDKLISPLDALNDRIRANNEESRTLSATRDLLLPKLMSGQIRIRAAEAVIAEAA